MLMTLAWQFARSFELNKINGIANHSQVKSRYLKSSYDEFWLECGGERRQTGWFALPQQEPIKDIQAVKSSKRSEFRRRMALRDELCESAAMTLEAMRSHSAPQTNNICATEPAPQPLASQHM
ncbi:hypothetical protein TUM12370_30130 [Salmonella enterica subsp. enterica serovar Choleraesuis]|nr:hypothetical protein TUM12370_30130 [Salmonella enterica subsp. enterica serovar Choleraesuis]